MKVRVFTRCCHKQVIVDFSHNIQCPNCGKDIQIVELEMWDINNEEKDATLHPGGKKRVSLCDAGH